MSPLRLLLLSLSTKINICQQEPLYHNFTYLDWWPRDGATDWDDESGRDCLLTNVVKDHQGMTGIRAPHDTA